ELELVASEWWSGVQTEASSPTDGRGDLQRRLPGLSGLPGLPKYLLAAASIHCHPLSTLSSPPFPPIFCPQNTVLVAHLAGSHFCQFKSLPACITYIGTIHTACRHRRAAVPPCPSGDTEDAGLLIR